MPRLSHISIQDIQLYGVPWASLVAILSHTGLRILDVQDSLHHWDIEDSPASALFFPAPPLTTYRHSLPDYRSRPRDLEGDLGPLACLASQRQFQLSLETLIVPSEAVPFAELAAVEWHRLKMLHIRGERPSVTPPLVCAFGKMPVLQELHVNLACTRTTGSVMICTSDWRGPVPWPELKTLVVSNPHPEDPLYSYLPTSLRHFALRCWPRRYVHVLSHERPILTELGWYPYILTASEMIQVLSRCGSLDLEELELEFEVDERHMELLHLITVAFPNLVSLTVFRYCQPGHPHIPTVSTPA
ncbi:uncharacterized protein TRAVEDRAFT_43898 [Trametes versicolor FP-101664 SS1]|uniref:uncharacterized protein n=1 Tax=Trametes versicolor (strain FP-101664) TaxID=717944 RepID=UPI0004622816|nr:uncharacterized protein TRAVEDRAFT_43898 [Trametes versicolor FP-101664 SS1]EIW63615.1 hypothetical protein TRAVEDRAFT_43898 [Trametes versicolor FP-101664 SS1]